MLFTVAIAIGVFIAYLQIYREAHLQPDEDMQLFADEDCISSCWQGLRPGLSSFAEVMQHLANEPFSIVGAERVSEEYALVFARQESHLVVNALMQDNILRLIEISSTQQNMTASDVIGSLGEPEYASYAYSPAGQFNKFEASMSLYYPDYGYLIVLRNSDGLTARLNDSDEIEICSSPDAPVVSVRITESGTIEELLRDTALPFGDGRNSIDSPRRWSGFGCVIAS